MNAASLPEINEPEADATAVPAYALNPRQEHFLALYLEPSSRYFGNCFRAAVEAGFSLQTARNLTHNRPKWLSEKLGQVQTMEPELLKLKLTDIINDPAEGTQTKLRAINMMMKHFGMYAPTVQTHLHLNIESVLE